MIGPDQSDRRAFIISAVCKLARLNFHAVIAAPAATAIEFRNFIVLATIAPYSAILLRNLMKGVAACPARPAGQHSGHHEKVRAHWFNRQSPN
jgi:hypothetical protein